MSGPESLAVSGWAARSLAVLVMAGGLALGLVLVQAAMGHWAHRPRMVGVVANYRLLPSQLVRGFAFGLPVAELGLGLGLVAAPWVGGLWAALMGVWSAGLMLVFALAIGINLRRGRAMIDCGCGDPQTRQRLSPALVWRNLVLAVAPALLPLVAMRGGALGLSTLDQFSTLAGGVALFCLYHLFNAIVVLRSSALSAAMLPVGRK